MAGMSTFTSGELRHVLPRLLEASPVGSDAPAGAVTLAAVLVPVLAAGEDPRLIFTKRSDSMSRHAGEISFPGGLAEPGEPLAATALREAQEELGLSPAEVELAGALPAVHTRVTGTLIVPFVGFLARDPTLTPNDAEIAEVLEYSLDALLEAGAELEWEWQGHRFPTFAYDMGAHVIWGATARILWSLIDLLEPDRRPWTGFPRESEGGTA
jgi:8-oxo-dGTP pyrophosphatase MutT (NUDIX family)